MTLEDWLACPDHSTLTAELSTFSDRKLHLLAAAFLRRVWDLLPSQHSRAAVEATETYVDGLISVDSLAWARSQAERESAEQVWLAHAPFEEYDLLYPEDRCPCCGWREARYECRVAKQGGILDGVKGGLEDPAWVAARAAFHTLMLLNPAMRRTEGPDWEWTWRDLFGTTREVLGSAATPDARWAEWRTHDVLALARGIHRDQAFDRLPILADALQDAGCDDETVLWHCREGTGHVRGCWVVDLAMGIE